MGHRVTKAQGLKKHIFKVFILTHRLKTFSHRVLLSTAFVFAVLGYFGFLFNLASVIFFLLLSAQKQKTKQPSESHNDCETFAGRTILVRRTAHEAAERREQRNNHQNNNNDRNNIPRCHRVKCKKIEDIR